MDVSVKQAVFVEFGVCIENCRTQGVQLLARIRVALTANLGCSGFGVDSGKPFGDQIRPIMPGACRQ